MACLNCNHKEQVIKNLQEKIIVLEAKLEKKAVVEGWKGEDEIKFERWLKGWNIEEHRKTKGTGEVTMVRHYIKDENVQRIADIIKSQLPKTNYRRIVQQLIINESLGLNIEEFNGGVNRAQYYFPLYYWPLKVLEHCKEIKYGGRGTVEVISNE